MKLSLSLILAPLIIFLTACSTHYSASSHHGHHRHGHVSVGVHGHHGGGEVLGALIVGGIIGHMLTEASQEEERRHTTVIESEIDDSDEVVNGYSIGADDVPEESRKWYQRGKDGNCYLMETVDGEAEIVSMVPKYSCN